MKMRVCLVVTLLLLLGSVCGAAPSASEIGAPIYPGAVFDTELSAGMSEGNDYKYYVFLTNDSPEAVASFYEQKLGKKPQKLGNSYMFALKGNLPIPDDGLVVEPNPMPNKTHKTTFTFQKQVE